MINIDTFLKIGDQHKICEDYIIQGTDQVPLLILSDGCSSSDNTEMGARILCYLAKQYLFYRAGYLHDLDYYQMGLWVIHNAEMTCRQLGLKIGCLDATLIVSYELDGTVYVYIYGDGAVITKNQIDIVQIDSVAFTNNAPYYLSYLIDEFRDEVYHSNKNEKALEMTCDGIEISRDIRHLAYDAEVVLKYSTRAYPNIFICSDGIESFIKKDPSQRDVLNPHEILPDMMAFKNTRGEFLKRRIKRALKDLDDQGITHYDDLSIGAYTRIN